MICAWDKLLQVLPVWMREGVDRHGNESLLELRLRHGQPPQLKLRDRTLCLEQNVTTDDFSYIINAVSNYSPWTASSVSQGYLTTEGGHRIGLCGEAIMKNGTFAGIKKVSSLCIRVARDFPGLSDGIRMPDHSLLLLGPPGSGKTTLLRDLIRRVSIQTKGSVAVVDERGELFPGDVFMKGNGIDVLTGCGKRQGIEMLLRTMGPDWIAVDEITAADDCEALMQAGWCGVRLLATAHARDLNDLRSRPVYRPLSQCGLFQNVCVLNRDRTYRMERIYG